MRCSEFGSPVGQLLLVADDAGLRLTCFESAAGPALAGESWRRDSAALSPVQTQFEEYFAGKRRRFDLPLAPEGISVPDDEQASLF